MKELERLLEFIKSGATQEEVNQFLRDNREAIGALTEPGALGDVVRQAGLTTEQASTFRKGYTKIIVPDQPGQGLVGQTGLLGAGAGIGGLGAGSVATVTAGGVAKQVVIGASERSLLAKAAAMLTSTGARKAGTLTVGAAGALALGGQFFGGGEPGGPPGTPGLGVPEPGADINARTRGPESGAFGITPRGAPQEQVPGQTPGTEVPVDPGFNIMIVDHSGQLTGTPGAIAVVASGDLGLTGGIDPTVQLAVQAQAIASGSEVVDFLQDYFVANSATQAASSAADREVLQVLFPESLGEINIGSPFQAQPSVPGQRLPSSFLPTQIPANVRGGLSDAIIEKEFEDVQRTDLTTQPVSVPAGAKLSPRIFTEFQGRTLLEWASISAQRYDVPLSLLYGIINHESGFSINAVGDNGNSFGLAQIFLPAWKGQITKGQALNPLFALEWTAQKLRERFNQYGRWDAAVAAHNSPQAASHLSRTGKFFNEKSANYVTRILNSASASGLAQYQFDTGADLPEIASTGPTFTPFQTPDPAQSREYIRSVYDDLLNRGATEDELITGVKQLEALARRAYGANLRQAQGGESQGVDIAAQFEEDIKGGGEFAFVEEVEDQSNFTDFAAGVARLLQQGI